MDWAVMIFAAGFGTRMGLLTQDRPKPLIEVAGRALVDHAADLARALPAGRILANTHYKAEMLEAHLAGTGVETLREAPLILDTGGGLRNALPRLGTGPVMTLNSDAIWRGPNPLELLADAWDPARMDGLLVCVPPERAIGYTGPGNFVTDGTGRISRGDGLVYGGAQIIRTDRLAEIGETAFSLNRLWDMMIAEGRLHGLSYPGRWCDVGHPEGITLAEDLLEGRDV
jgi:MurNAc alpha-1-phosphate uridylyltransferase